MSRLPPPVMTTDSVPGLEIEPQPTAWPKVIGIIAIVLGSLAAVGGCFGAAFTFLIGAVADKVPEDQAYAMEGVLTWRPWLVFLAMSSVVLALLLLMGGVGLVQRRGYGIKLCIAWALAKMVYVVANTSVGYLVNEAQAEAMKQDPNMAMMPAGFMKTVGAFGSIVGLLWGWALPVFMLIWFSRARIRAEVTSWGQPAPALPPPPATEEHEQAGAA